MLSKLQKLSEKYENLQVQMSDPKVLADAKLIADYSKEIADLQPIIEKYQQYQQNLTEIKDATEMLTTESDSQMRKMMEETVQTSKENLTLIENELKILLLPKDENDDKNVIVEIRGAAGGDEANIFAGDLYRMYLKYAEVCKWKIEILDENVADTGGFSLIAFKIKGKNVYSKLKFETGSHRVQRVPQTESQGRIHTSTATVLVMPEIDVIKVDVKEADIKVDTYRASGAGGQHVNTTDSAVRMTHTPTGIIASSQAERSQIKNREHALKMLKLKIYDHYKNEQLQKVSQNRKLKLGSGDRSEKIRTYNYPQNRVTDHRIGFTLNKLDQVMDGKLDEIIIALHNFDQAEKLQNIAE